MGIAPIQVAHPHCEVCLGWSGPEPPPPQQLTISPLHWVYLMSVVNLERCWRGGGAL